MVILQDFWTSFKNIFRDEATCRKIFQFCYISFKDKHSISAKISIQFVEAKENKKFLLFFNVYK